jgi:hypothetical protein
MVVAEDRAVPVSKIQNEKVRWSAKGNGGPWKITFDKNVKGSPFAATFYDILQPGGEVTTEGGPVGGDKGQSYSYRVRRLNPANPGQIIDPPTDPDPDIDVE